MEEKNKTFEKLVRNVYRVLNEEVKALYSNNNDGIKPLCLEIIKNSIISAEWYSYDNWNGGFNIYDIICLTDVSLYVKIQPNIEAIYNELLNQFNNLENSNDKYGKIIINLKNEDQTNINFDEIQNHILQIPFVVQNSNSKMPEYISGINFLPEKLPSFVLCKSLWDDFDYKTSFALFYCEEKGEVHKIGSLKIMERNTEQTSDAMKNTFFKLSDSFCSLGKNDEYYKNLRTVLNEDKSLIEYVLVALRDVSFNTNIYDDFYKHFAFKHSLIRDNSSERALRVGCLYIQGDSISNRYNFKYKFTPPYNHEESVEIDFNFDSRCKELERIYGLIGENGTGKSNFLKSLAMTDSRNIDNCFMDTKPIFSQLITVSYTPFNDHFNSTNNKKIFKHIFCGLHNSHLNNESIVDQFIKDFNLIIARGHLESLYAAVTDVIPRNILCECTNIHKIEYDSFNNIKHFEVFDKNDISLNIDNDNIIINSNDTKILIDSLSSGEMNYLMSMTALIANIRYDSLLLIDEPEQHMHPKAISILMIKIGELIKEFESFAIIATHSPLVVRELLSKNVYIFRRNGNQLTIPKISIESFGEDISILNNYIFGGDENEKRFEKLIREMIKEKPNKNYDDIVKELENKFLNLNMNTKLLIRQLITENRNEIN